jgi:hypothetical protein
VHFVKWDENFMTGYQSPRSPLEAASIAPGDQALSIFEEPASVSPFTKNRTFGTLCYDGTQWQLPEQHTGAADSPEWREVGIFAGPNGHGGEQLIATPKGGYDDRGLKYLGTC